MSDDAGRDLERERLHAHTTVLLGILVLYQAWLACSAFRKVATLQRMLDDFGGTPPRITSTLLAALPWGPAVPVFFTAVAVWVWRSQRISIRTSCLVLGAGALACVLMEAWIVEGFFAPILRAAEQVR